MIKIAIHNVLTYSYKHSTLLQAQNSSHHYTKHHSAKLNNFNSQDFNLYSFLTRVYIII